MAEKKQKKAFEWEAGKNLAADDYEPVKEVRDFGFTKMADGILADPVSRKEARKKKLTKPLRAKSEEFFVEESESGLHDDYTPSEAARLIQKDTKGLRGMRLFSKKPDLNKNSKK